MSWIDDLLTVGADEEIVKSEKTKLTSTVDCDDTGEMKEYVGCKIDYDREQQRLKITQPVLIQSFWDEFELPNEEYSTPAAPNKTLQKKSDESTLSSVDQTTYQSGVGKLLHLM